MTGNIEKYLKEGWKLIRETLIMIKFLKSLKNALKNYILKMTKRLADSNTY